MALTILKIVGVKNCDVVLGLTGFVVSIPVFCDSGFVILSSLAKEFSRLTKKSMVWLGGILGMGLYITHFMVPPTPGPLAVVSTFQQEGIAVDLGLFIIFGLILSVPLFIFSIYLFRYFGKKYPDLVVPYDIDRSQYTDAQLAVLDKIDAKMKSGKEYRLLCCPNRWKSLRQRRRQFMIKAPGHASFSPRAAKVALPERPIWIT